MTNKLCILLACLLQISSLYINQLDGLPLTSMTGKFQMTKSDNFDEYMKAVGAGVILRVLASNAKPVTDISEKDGSWNIKTTTSFKTTDIQFKLGVPFREMTADGRDCKSTITQVDDTLVHKQRCGGKDYEILRKFEENGTMTMTLSAPGPVVSVRIYKKV